MQMEEEVHQAPEKNKKYLAIRWVFFPPCCFNASHGFSLIKIPMKTRSIIRALVVTASLILAGALYLPIWRIELAAPQYPEGLVLLIFANGIRGDVDIINGLNHYIGMNTLHSTDFIEFTLLPYIIASLVLLGIITSVINKKRIYYTYISLFIFVAILSMVDFYRWEYDYGHHLNPKAAIQVPGMSYQPPLIGYKQLLNFGAYSIPDIGGWLFIASAVLLVISFLLILQPKWLPFYKAKIVFTLIVISCFTACSTEPEPIKYGVVACDFCKMTIVDKRFAAEWVTDKGKVFRFDDIGCFRNFRKLENAKGAAYLNDYNGKQSLVKAENLYYLFSTKIKAPMGGNTVAFISKEERDSMVSVLAGNPVTWSEIIDRK